MKTQAYLIFIAAFFLSCTCAVDLNSVGIEKRYSELFTAQKKIELPDYPDAFNPSLIKHNGNLLLTFRYTPYQDALWISYIGIVILDDSLNPAGEPQLLETREGNFATPSQSEDCRIFSSDGKLYIIYNDNEEVENPSYPKERRDMFLAELYEENGRFTVSPPLKLVHETRYPWQSWQKNWVPFDWNGTILLSYTIRPHEILLPDLMTGLCRKIYSSRAKIRWPWGTLRGGTPAIKVGEDYLAFYHSSVTRYSEASTNLAVPHYYMGAYIFSSEPPFKIKKYLPSPLIGENFYVQSELLKRVVFPGGFVVEDNKIHIAFGKDDAEIWIATINKEALLNSMVNSN